MKKIIISLVFVFAISSVVSPFDAEAITGDSTNTEQTTIEYLLGVVEELKAKVAELIKKREAQQTVVKPPSEPSKLTVYCPVVDRLLERGTSGSDVGELQEFLKSTGDYQYGSVTNYYGSITEAAVQRFQERASVVSGGDSYTTGYGVFGPLTQRAMYNYCKIPDPVACTMEYDPVCGMPRILSCPVGMDCTTAKIMPQPKTYSNLCHLKSAGAEYLYDGECRGEDDPRDPTIPKNCKVWYDGCNTCARTAPGERPRCTMVACFQHGTPYCKEYFDDDRNKPPTISSFSGPTLLEVGETGEWVIKASDPEDGDLSYHVTWGDEATWNVSSPAAELDFATDFVQRTTFEHEYDSAGVYTVTVVVMDEERQQTRTSTTVKVVQEEPVACTTEYDPVCGHKTSCIGGDNEWIMAPCTLETKTFSNMCFLKSAGYTYAYDGECDGESLDHRI
jgi:hypothetical protein